MTPETGTTGLLGSLRGLAGTLMGLALTRLQLVGVELAEEKQRLLGTLVKLLAAVLFCALGLVVFSFWVVAFFWDTHRLAALGGLTAVYLVLGVGLALRVKREIVEHPPWFEATLAELAKDRAHWEAALKQRTVTTDET